MHDESYLVGSWYPWGYLEGLKKKKKDFITCTIWVRKK